MDTVWNGMRQDEVNSITYTDVLSTDTFYSNTACATYYLAETPNAAKTLTSYNCANKPSVFNVYATLTQTLNTRTNVLTTSNTLLPTKAISCVPDDFAVSHGDDCAT